MEKRASGGVSLDYEPINDRILRLRKEVASHNKSTERDTNIRVSYQTQHQKFEMHQIDKILKENKLKIDPNLSSKSDLTRQGFLSPKRYKVSKLLHQRIPTEQDRASDVENILECKSPRSRIPGKIIKNPSKKSLIQQSSQHFKTNLKYFI